MIAKREVALAKERGIALDAAFVERAAATVHAAWVERNHNHVRNELKVPYHELPETEKDKDRTFVNDALDMISFHREEKKTNTTTTS